MRPIDADAFEKYAWSNPDIEVDGEPYISPSAVQNFATDHPIVIDQPNDSLTLDELREMDGKPVYVVIDDGFEPLKMWALVDYIKEEQCLTLTNNLGGRSQYYTADDLEIDHITAYRRPPEGEGDT